MTIKNILERATSDERRGPVVIVGPTASGKTEVALELAHRINAEIINADSRQIYQQLNIGTAKPPLETPASGNPLEPIFIKGIAHYLIDFIDPCDIFSAGDFALYGTKAIQKIQEKGKKVLVVGGTGLYIRALLDGMAKLPSRDEKIRLRLEAQAQQEGRQALYQRLCQVDPTSAKTIHPNNIARLIRALEVYELTGIPISSWHKQTPRPAWNCLYFGIQWPKEELHRRIEARVHGMLARGMIEETKKLLEQGYPKNCPGFLGLGYRDVIQFLEGKLSRGELTAKITQDTKAYAKRQMTWFRKDPRIQWMPAQTILEKLTIP